MRATDFEVRHQTMLHFLVLGAAFLAYAFQRDDIVWAFIKDHADRRLLERIVFGVGTVLIFASAALGTWARAYAPNGVELFSPQAAFLRNALYLGRIIFALGVGLLAPAFGTAILLVGESILILRLFGHDRERLVEAKAGRSGSHAPLPRPSQPAFAGQWGGAFRQESSKWGLAFTMVAFTLTLKDGVADVLGGASLLLWTALNLPDFLRSRSRGGSV